MFLKLKCIKQFLVWGGIFARGELHISCLVCWESLLFHGVYIKSSPQKPRGCAGMCLLSQVILRRDLLQPLSTSGFVSSPALVLGVSAFPGTSGCVWEMRMDLGAVAFAPLVFSAQWIQQVGFYRSCFPGIFTQLMRRWMVAWAELCPELPSFIKHLTMTEPGIKSR